MTIAPVRPIFQNGQRLTAERLTEAFEFLRTMIRRVLLAPLSAGVAGGFEFEPPLGQRATVLEITPGLAIDGKGRLLVVPEAHRFTAQEIAAAAGIGTPSDGVIVRVCLALDDSSAGTDPCSPHRPLEIEEAARFLFIRETLSSAAAQFFAQFNEPNCVDAWSNLDLPGPSNDACCVTLGHVVFRSQTEFEATSFFRQGVSPRFNVIRNTNGAPSIVMGDARIDLAALGFPGQPMLEESAVGIPVTTIFGPKPVAFTGPALFTIAGGRLVQATHVGPFGVPFSAGSFAAGGDPRMFLFPGGAGTLNADNTSELGAGLGGVAAVPCALRPGSATVDRAGIPLAVANNGPGAVVQVEATTNPTSDAAIGISAGPQFIAFGGSVLVAPVAVAGIVKARVNHSGPVTPGTALTADSTAGLLRSANAGEVVLARMAQAIFGGSSPTDVFVWAVHLGSKQP